MLLPLKGGGTRSFRAGDCCWAAWADAALDPLLFFLVVTGPSELGPPWPGDLKSPAEEKGFRFDRAKVPRFSLSYRQKSILM